MQCNVLHAEPWPAAWLHTHNHFLCECLLASCVGDLRVTWQDQEPFLSSLICGPVFVSLRFGLCTFEPQDVQSLLFA